MVASIYVKDVAKSVAFYAKALSFTVQSLDESYRLGELESEQTTIAFTPIHQRETEELTGSVESPFGGRPQQFEICLDYPDVYAAYKCQ